MNDFLRGFLHELELEKASARLLSPVITTTSKITDIAPLQEVARHGKNLAKTIDITSRTGKLKSALPSK